MELTLVQFDKDYARLNNIGWHIYGQPLAWWARCPRCQEITDASYFEGLVAAIDAHVAAGCDYPL